jgi:ABC-type polysaccharide/polyol phosphate transport system ATPase subunit
MSAISLKDVWLKYRVGFKEGSKVVTEDFWAIREVNMDISRGEAVFIIGENGAGKTTLLKVIAGMLKPDIGEVKINGRVSALLEIGAGFQKDLTGKENIYLTSSFFGLTREQVDSRYRDIVEFASIGRFINASVKHYSQGMYMRLAFAIAIHVNPDILLIDDVFAVGDLYAQQKCIDRMFQLREAAKTIIFVTHNVETAKRFCQRGMLFKDGRIINQGLPKEVISYYLRTIGDKKGIGVLQGRDLGLVFNNGKLILNWRNDNITKEWAGHTSILTDGNRYSSLQADWHIKEAGDKRVVLEGRCWDLPVLQLWEIRLDDEKNELSLKIDFDIQQDCPFEEFKICFMFRDEYTLWFDPFRKEAFGADDLKEEFLWKHAGDQEETAGFIGLGTDSSCGVSLPSVVLEDDLYFPGKILSIRNTNREFKARTLESGITYPRTGRINLGKGLYTLFHNKIKVIKEAAAEEYYRKDSPASILSKTIGDKAGLSLTVESCNRVEIYWKERKISAAMGLKTVFSCDGRVYESGDYPWIIHKISDNHVCISIRWPDVPLRQFWDIELLGYNLLSWKVYIGVYDKTVIKNNEFRAMFSPAYLRWFTAEETGRVCETLRAQFYKDIIMKNGSNGIIGLEAGPSADLTLPGILLHDTTGSKFNSAEQTIDINNFESGKTYKSEPVVCLYFLDINDKESVNFSQGSYLIHDCRIFAGGETEKDEYLNQAKKAVSEVVHTPRSDAVISGEEAVLKNGRYKFIFIKGAGKIFSGSDEITKNFGLYTSLYSRVFDQNGSWYTSAEALWEIINRSKNRLIVSGKWPYLPVSQIWDIKITSRGFRWRVDMDVSGSVAIDRQHAKLMISQGYKNWDINGKDTGSFPDEFALAKWDTLYGKTAFDRLSINARGIHPGDNLPRVSFSCLKDGGFFEAVVENSNTTFKSRVLGFDRIINNNERPIRPGVYRYFYGEINLYGE